MTTADFQFIKEIGKGTFSTVYKVRRRIDGKYYALKKIIAHKLKPKERENQLNEIRILASIDNPYIIAYKEAFFEDNDLYIVMEYANDGDLFMKIKARKYARKFFSEEFIWSLFIQVIQGLRALHGINILHRDIKWANIFMCKNGNVKLGDFNVAKEAKGGMLDTQTGTPYYASPEIWNDKSYDVKSDIWSLGIVLYESISLMPPFFGTTMKELYTSIMKGSFKHLPKRFSKNLMSLCRMMLATKPSMRPSCEKIWQIPWIKQQIEQVNSQYQLLDTIRFDNEAWNKTPLPPANYRASHGTLLSARSTSPDQMKFPEEEAQQDEQPTSQPISRQPSPPGAKMQTLNLTLPKSGKNSPKPPSARSPKLQFVRPTKGTAISPKATYKRPGIRHIRSDSAEQKGNKSGLSARARSPKPAISCRIPNQPQAALKEKPNLIIRRIVSERNLKGRNVRIKKNPY